MPPPGGTHRPRAWQPSVLGILDGRLAVEVQDDQAIAGGEADVRVGPVRPPLLRSLGVVGCVMETVGRPRVLADAARTCSPLATGASCLGWTMEREDSEACCLKLECPAHARATCLSLLRYVGCRTHC